MNDQRKRTAGQKAAWRASVESDIDQLFENYEIQLINQHTLMNAVNELETVFDELLAVAEFEFDETAGALRELSERVDELEKRSIKLSPFKDGSGGGAQGPAAVWPYYDYWKYPYPYTPAKPAHDYLSPFVWHYDTKSHSSGTTPE